MHEPRAGLAVQRITVVVDSDLLAALQAHQRKLEGSTNLRVSLSQIAGSLMRSGLALSSGPNPGT